MITFSAITLSTSRNSPRLSTGFCLGTEGSMVFVFKQAGHCFLRRLALSTINILVDA